MQKNRIKTLFIVLLVVMLIPMQAMAEGKIDEKKQKTITVQCMDGEKPLIGVKIRIFQIASMDERGELTATETFREFPVNIRGKDDEAWKTLATTLEAYILRDDVTEDRFGVTDQQGTVQFGTDGREPDQGIFLILFEKHTQNGWIYEIAPAVVSLPGRDKEQNEWVYDVTVHPKFESTEEPKRISIGVLKIWKDDGYEKERPEKVEIQLLKNGEILETVELSKENNWKHNWTDLMGEAHYTVTESEVKGYTVEITKERNSFVVTNTYEDTGKTPVTPEEPLLPQTGQLWWPVPILVSAGLFSIVIGVLRRKMIF